MLGAAALSAQDAKKALAAPIDESKLLLNDPAETAAPETPEGPGPGAVFGAWDFIRMILVLALVIGLIYAFFHFLKKMAAPHDEGVKIIQVLESRTLAGNRNIHLVEIGNQILLVGSSENSVSLISEISDKETIDEIRLKASETLTGAAGGKSFSDLLKGFLTKKSLPTGAAGEQSLEFMKKQRERLDKLL